MRSMSIPGYKILRKLGDGGMSSVYLAIQLSVGREVALKILSPELRTDPSFGDRFFREANIVGTLSHPNIIAIYDVGTHDEHYYMAMDFLSGSSCNEKIKSGTLSTTEILRITKDIASALDYVHERGFIHCDVKPDNILFRHDGSAVLTDFGIATAASSAIKNPELKAVAGTPHYMSPEQTQGKSLDGRSDLYSLGILLYEMLSGEPPFKGKDAISVAVKHLSAPIPSLPIDYKVFQPLINRMLAKKPSSRYQSGRDIIDAINALEHGLGKQQGGTKTEPTALQAYSLLEALIATFGHVSKEMLKRSFTKLEIITRLRYSRKHGLLVKERPVPRMPVVEPLNSSTIPDDATTHLNTQTFFEDLDAAIASNRARRIISPAFIMLFLLTVSIAALMPQGFLWLEARTEKDRPSLIPEITSADHQQQIAIQAEALTPTSTARAIEQLQPESEDSLDNIAVTARNTETETNAEARMEASKLKSKEESESVRYKLTINTKPEKARVRILNIKPRYRDGIALKADNYHISVSADGYFSKTFWVALTDKDLVTNTELVKIPPKIKAGDLFADTLSDGNKGPQLVVVPAGEYMMGDSINQDNKEALPVHKVTINKNFAIGIYEITFAEYALFARSNDRPLPPGHDDLPENHPVANISWTEATEYTNWLSKMTGQIYRLPSESEWEYAARANSQGNYWWNNDSAKNRANCRKGCDSPWVKLFRSSSAPVDSFDKNSFGLYNTAGNIAEWVADCFVNNYEGAPTTERARTTPDCEYHSIRGGSYKDADTEITNASRSRAKTSTSRKTIGFRVLREL